MWRRCLWSLPLIAALCHAQHVQFGSYMWEGLPAGGSALDAEGNLVVLNHSLALGICCGMGSRLLVIVNQFRRDGSVRTLAESGINPAGETPGVVAVDRANRVYIGVSSVNGASLVRVEAGDRKRLDLPGPPSFIFGISFTAGGEPVVGAMAGSAIRVFKLDPATGKPTASGTLDGIGGTANALTVDASGNVYIAGTSPADRAAFVAKLTSDLQSVAYTARVGEGTNATAAAIQAAADGVVYMAGQQDRGADAAPIGFIARLGAGGELLSSRQLGGARSESIDGLMLDSQNRVIVHGYTRSHDFPATGVYRERCGPDRGEANAARFLTRLDPSLEQIDKSIVLSGLTSLGLPNRSPELPRAGQSFLMGIDRSLAAVEMDVDRAQDVSCVASGASYTGADSVTPGQLLAIFGKGLGPDKLAAFETGGTIPSVVDGTEVLFGDVRAPILVSSANQLVVVVPFEIGVNTWMQVRRNGEQIYARNWRSTFVRPESLIRISGEGAVTPMPGSPTALLADVWNEDGTRNSESNPAAPGSQVTVFATGLGALDAALPPDAYGDSQARPATQFVITTPSARITDVTATTLPGRTVGVTGVQFRVPSTESGILPFTIELPYAGPNSQPANFLYVRK